MYSSYRPHGFSESQSGIVWTWHWSSRGFSLDVLLSSSHRVAFFVFSSFPCRILVDRLGRAVDWGKGHPGIIEATQHEDRISTVT